MLSRPVVLALLLMLLPALAAAATPLQETESPPMAAAKQWLALLDEGKLEQAWNQADVSLREKNELGRWSTELRRQRQSQAAVECRRNLELNELDNPDRVEILFLTQFDDGQLIGERVTVTDGGGDGEQPRVTAYRSGPPLPDRGPACEKP